jgi:hypothetical protein
MASTFSEDMRALPALPDRFERIGVVDDTRNIEVLQRHGLRKYPPIRRVSALATNGGAGANAAVPCTPPTGSPAGVHFGAARSSVS